MTDRGTKATRERKAVFDEITNEIDSKPLTLEELRQRLKHIAGLCWGLSVDIANELEELDNLKTENKQLQEKIKYLKGRLGLHDSRESIREEKLAAMTPEERKKYSKKLARQREYSKEKYLEKTAIFGGQNNAE